MTYLSERQNVPVGTVMDLDAQAPRTIRRDWDHLLIPELRLDAAGRAILRAILSDAEPDLARVHAELAEDEAEARGTDVVREAADIAWDRTHPDPYRSWVNGEPPAIEAS
jgi:hypothetical protein